MSSHVVQSCEVDNGINLELNKARIILSPHPDNSQWMTHWMRSSSSSTSQIQKEYAASNENGNAKFREVKRLSVEVMRSSMAEYQDVSTLGPGEKDVRSDFQPIDAGHAKSIGVENGFSLRHGENLSTEWNQFPMFDINRKLECILASKKRSKFGTMAVTMRESQFVNNESILGPHEIKFASEEHHLQVWNMTQSTDQGVRSCNFTDSQVSRLNCQRLGMESPLCTDKRTAASNSKMACGKPSNTTKQIHLKNDQILVSEVKDDNQTNCNNLDDTSLPFLFDERGKKTGSTSGSAPSHGSTPGLSKIGRSKSPGLFSHEIQKFSNGTRYPSLKKMGMDSIDGDASKSVEVLQTALSKPGETSSSYQKGVVRSQRISSPVKQAIQGKDSTSLQDMNKLSKSSKNTMVFSTSKTESMDADHILCNVERIDNSQFTHMVESSSHPESSNRWFKCRRRDPPDCFALGTKRLKFADAMGCGRSCTLFNQILSYKGSSSHLAHCSEERTESDRTMLLTEKGECSSQESEKKIDSWIRRWHCGGYQMASQAEEAAPVLCKPECTKSVPKKLDTKQLPSIAAMALMGRAVSNFRPCQFRRKGSCVVWNTEESNSH